MTFPGPSNRGAQGARLDAVSARHPEIRQDRGQGGGAARLGGAGAQNPQPVARSRGEC
ncbi:hypothetical protein ACFVZH_36445 [Streptomyces sp. NPDC059534]|uniref:hypothetical protein n=1 Tax=Streptomyces sp. NPDC059534 TaxID=3346859 RepID=UPI0036AFF235